MRVIEATFPNQFRERVTAAVAGGDPIDLRVSEHDGDGRCVVRALTDPDKAQGILDSMQAILEHSEGWRIIVLPVEATAPKIEPKETEAERAERRNTALREEIYDEVSKGADLSHDFLVLTALSALVAAIGLNADNVAAVIAAMVIAPLLGPILAFSFAGALGDFELMIKSGRTAVIGLSTGVGIAIVLGLTTSVNLGSHELLARADLGLDSAALALASGAAAALTIVTGLSSALVGVMVAVALAPPAVAAGLFLGSGEPTLAAKAGVLLVLNVVCVNLAAQAVYAWKGVRPRTWLEQRSAKMSVRINVAVWATSLVALIGLIIWSQTN